MTITCNTQPASFLVSEREMHAAIEANSTLIGGVQRGEEQYEGFLGWLDVQKQELEEIENQAVRVKELAQVMIVIGIGGSNRGAAAALEVLKRTCTSPTSLFFAGDTLSSTRLADALDLIESKSVVLNVIAKDFNTVEPGITFRLLRRAMQAKYGAEYAKRIVVTGSKGGGQLYELAALHGYAYLPFPSDIGGRFSVLSPVGLFPLAVAGVDIRTLLSGACAMEKVVRTRQAKENPAVRYAILRSLIKGKGIALESLVTFEPDLQYFTRWWIQLFAETEGKTEMVLFPVGFSYSEDLHAVGQYVQQGPRVLLETYLDVQYAETNLIIETSRDVLDNFGYLDNKHFSVLNKAVYQAALNAHCSDGVPCIELKMDTPLDAETLGGLFYFFLFSAYLSARLLGVNPFTQEGVEQYKRNMYAELGKPGYTKYCDRGVGNGNQA